MTNEDVVKVAREALKYFTTTDMNEEEEQDFLDYWYNMHGEQEGN